ncbi:excinuclease ABC subunit A, partial [Leptospira interrogans]
DGGGLVIAEGIPKDIAKIKNSYTGQYLKKIFTSSEKISRKTK